ncbi:MAG: hypothetical protein KatS3mg009_2642 [Acidimicrobiia bacterium]|nr:MAG: hypothetical protein KatS3mg009_2642 [Acidimicrobiia bacterium]
MPGADRERVLPVLDRYAGLVQAFGAPPGGVAARRRSATAPGLGA